MYENSTELMFTLPKKRPIYTTAFSACTNMIFLELVMNIYREFVPVYGVILYYAFKFVVVVFGFGTFEYFNAARAASFCVYFVVLPTSSRT